MVSRDHLRRLLDKLTVFLSQEELSSHVWTKISSGISIQTRTSRLETLSQVETNWVLLMRTPFSRTIQLWLIQKQAEELSRCTQMLNTQCLSQFAFMRPSMENKRS